MARSRRTWLFLTVGVALIVMLVFTASPRLREARRAAFRTSCVHNLKILALCLKMYAEDHEGHFPDRLSKLYPKYITDPAFLICPEIRTRKEKAWGATHPFSANPTPDEFDALSSYTYVSGFTTADDKNTIIAYEKQDNHFGMGRSLLYLDGHGAWEPPENWRNGPPNTTVPAGF